MEGQDCFGGLKFHLFSSDELAGFYRVGCRSCGEEYVLAVRNGRVEVLPNIDEMQD